MPPPIPAARRSMSRRSAAARRGSAPIRSRSRCPPISRRPFYLDMATSAVAAGKIALAVARGEEIPTGWIVDAEGRHTTDPTQYRKGGALLPLGGTEGYKGSGLAAMVEVLCGLLTGLGFGVEPTGRHNDGMLHGGVQRRRVPPAEGFQEGGRRVRALSEIDAAVGRLARRVLSRRGRISARAGAPQERHRDRGRDLGQTARARRRIQDRRRTRSA